MVARAGVVVFVVLVMAACSAASDGFKVEGGGPTGWVFADATVPKGIEPPVAAGGLVLNSYRDPNWIVVTIVYGAEDRIRLEAIYDDWSETSGGFKSGRGFDVGVAVAWQDSWEAGLSEVRMTECLNELSGEFDNLCVALTTSVGSVP